MLKRMSPCVIIALLIISLSVTSATESSEFAIVGPTIRHIEIDEFYQLDFNTGDNAYEFISTSPSVASVDQNGMVRGIRRGSTIIILRTLEGIVGSAISVRVEYKGNITNRNSIVYYKGPSGEDLLPAKELGLASGTTHTEHAQDIPGYIPDEYSKTITITSSENIIVFRYSKRTDLKYSVNYKGPNGVDLIAEKTVNNCTFGEKYTEIAPGIAGYSPDAAEKSVVITTGANGITFNYVPDIITSKSLTINAATNNEYFVCVSYSHIKKKDFTVKLSYPTARLQLLDITAQTESRNLVSDSESASRVEIISNSGGVVTFKMKQGIDAGMMGSGDITILKFRAISSGHAVLNIESV